MTKIIIKLPNSKRKRSYEESEEEYEEEEYEEEESEEEESEEEESEEEESEEEESEEEESEETIIKKFTLVVEGETSAEVFAARDLEHHDLSSPRCADCGTNRVGELARLEDTEKSPVASSRQGPRSARAAHA